MRERKMTNIMDGKVVLVTGADGGIGRNIALTTAAGAAVMVNNLAHR
jgi:NAD(P)-dependent dehydrogenase (short-subunit alcohol dehydrogenase family)